MNKMRNITGFSQKRNYEICDIYFQAICFNYYQLYACIIGSSPPGEFFSPGYDCTSILNKDLKAKDGFYWITLGYKIPRKVCTFSE